MSDPPKHLHSMKAYLLAAAAVLCVMLDRGHAADVYSTNEKLCAFRLEGTILSGDYNRLLSLINSSRIDQFDERTFTICLKSPGGSYDEAVKISELVFERGISTAITSGSGCFSACAIIFMAGVTQDQIIPLRKLSAGAILGFHAPYLVVPDKKYSKDELEHATQSMRLAILSLVRLSSRQTQLGGGEFLKRSLIARILEKGPRDAFVVTTVAEAARWDILVYDASDHLPPASDKVAEVKNICNNFHYANMDQPVPPDTNLSLKIEQYASRYHKDDFRILVRNNKTNDTVCEIYARSKSGNKKVEFFACSYDYWSSKSFGNCREYKTSPLFGKYVPEFFTRDPSTALQRSSR